MTDSQTQRRVLIVEPDPDTAALIDKTLRAAGFATAAHGSAEQALEAIAAESFDVVVADIQMAGIDGIELCRRVRDNYANVPVVVLTTSAAAETASAVMGAGALDLLRKPLRLEDLGDAVARAAARSEDGERMVRVPSTPAPEPPVSLRGSSTAWRRVVRELQRVARSEATVLVSGESGTGKELLARALHDMSDRRHAPFVAVNCAAIPAKLLESELFGHVKGAFTGAGTDRQGLLRQAASGTLLLDEVGAMPVALQSKLLRTLQTRRIRPVGASNEVPFEARLLAATNEDLHDAVADGGFREDLLYRLEVLRIDVPPLRQRRGDVVELARSFIPQLAAEEGKPIAGLSDAAERHLVSYPWPGNVRELRNCLEAAVALTRGPRIELEDLPATVRAHVPAIDPARDADTLEAVQRRHIERVLQSVDGNRLVAARVLGLSRSTLYRKLQKLGIATQ